MSEYTVTAATTPPRPALQAAALQPLSTLISKTIEAMIASGELAIVNGVIVRPDPRPIELIALPTEARLEL